MSSTSSSDYSHTQSGKLLLGVLLVSGGGVIVLLIAMLSRWGMTLPMMIGPILIAVILLLCSFAFSSLTVRVGGGTIELRFGPGWISKRFPLSEVISAKPVHNPWHAGWGIHYVGRGWLYNVAGLDAVEIEMKNGSRQRIGTDEPAALAAAITRQL